MYGYIYKTTQISTGLLYIGLHKKDTFEPYYIGSGTKLREALKNSGRQDFVCEMIDTAETQEELNEKEIFWIQYFNATDPQIGYNVSRGGEWCSTIRAAEHRAKMSEKASHSRWWTNGIEEMFSEECPAGFIRGRSKKSQQRLMKQCVTIKDKLWINNGKQEQYIDKDVKLPEGWMYGRLKGRKQSTPRTAWNKGVPNVALKGTLWVNDGNEQHQISAQELELWQSKGFVRGMISKKTI